jgi:hypothetical protein
MLPHRAIREVALVLTIVAIIWTGVPIAIMSATTEPIDSTRVFVTLLVVMAFTAAAIRWRLTKPDASAETRAPGRTSKDRELVMGNGKWAMGKGKRGGDMARL